jgi:2,4-dienoyl-CoA reductase-like NADH-dependent reductase (Old Yellow Enzyme family)/thioredoxin reductase
LTFSFETVFFDKLLHITNHKKEVIMSIMKTLIGRRQFLAAAGIGSASALALGKLGGVVDPVLQARAAMAGEKAGLIDLNTVSDKYKHILSPLKIGNVVLKNRFFLPQSIPHFLQGPENFPSDELRAYYIQMARNGAGLISVRIMGNRGSRKEQHGDSAHMIMLDTDDPGVQNYIDQLVEGIHIYGSKACAALQVGGGGGPSPQSASGQGGTQGQGMPGGQSGAQGQGMPSGMPSGQGVAQGQGMSSGTPGGQGMPGGAMPSMTYTVKAYTAEELEKMGETAVKNAKELQSHGIDAVQIGIRGNHSASLALCKAVKKSLPDMLIITELFIREASITPHPTDQYYVSAVSIEEGIKYAKQLEGAADILHVRIGDGSAAHATTWNSIKGKPYAIAYSEAIKKSGAKIVVMPGAGFQDLDLNEDYIKSGKADMISEARAFICDSEYGKKMSSGRGEDVVPCIRCNKCHGLSMSGPWYTVCSVNPRIGLPLGVKAIEAPTVQKKVAVIGGGVAGMQAAITSAERGHKVTLYEKDSTLGGLARHSEYSPYKWSIKDYKDYLAKRMGKLGVTVLMNTVATPEMIQAKGFDTVLVGVGSDPVKAKIPGADGANVYDIMDAYSKDKSMGKNVVVIGGGEYGADAGMFLAKAGHNVTMLTSGRELIQQNRPHYPEIIVETYSDLKNFSIIPQGTATGISNGKVTYKDAGGSEKSVSGDSVVLFSGLKPKKDEALQFVGTAKQFFIVGDCGEQGGTIQRCTRSAFFAASQV